MTAAKKIFGNGHLPSWIQTTVLLGTLIWGGANIYSKIEVLTDRDIPQIRTELNEVHEHTEKNKDTLHLHQERIVIIETKFDAIQTGIQEIKDEINK